MQYKQNKKQKETEKPNEIRDIVEKILDFIRQNQKRQGLEILTLDQMLSRVPMTLAQLQARNNSQKLKNQIRLLLYLLYHSKTFDQSNL